MKTAAGTTRTRNRITLLAIVAVFLVPFALAWILALGPLEWRPPSTLNHGVLLKPPLSLTSYGMQDGDGGELNMNAIAGDWFLVVLHTSSCAAACQGLAQTADRIRLAVGRDSDRVTVILLGPEKADLAMPVENWILPAAHNLLADLRRATGEQQPNNLLLLVDYQGYVVLAYPRIEDVYDPLRDLETLLSAVPN